VQHAEKGGYCISRDALTLNLLAIWFQRGLQPNNEEGHLRIAIDTFAQTS